MIYAVFARAPIQTRTGKTAPSDKRHGEYNIQEQVFASRAYSYLDALNLRT